MAANPVSWYAIEPGWSVTSRDGGAIGTVASVLGDENLDIFHGLVCSFWVGKRQVPAELVTTIEPGKIELGITDRDVAGLAPS
jgi:hypothetical protein